MSETAGKDGRFEAVGADEQILFRLNTDAREDALGEMPTLRERHRR